MKVKFEIPAKDVTMAKKKAQEALMRWLCAPKSSAPTVITGNGYHCKIITKSDGSVEIELDLNPERLSD
jgi:hypothetical protein